MRRSMVLAQPESVRPIPFQTRKPARRAALDQDAGLSAVIGNIYDAALDPSQWSSVLGEARDFVGGSAAAIYAKDAAGKAFTVFHDDGGIEDHYKRLYFERYLTLDPSTTAHLFSTVENPVSTVDFIPYHEMLETRFYQEWARPQGLVDFITCVLEKSITTAVLFGIFRHERNGVVDDASRHRMRLIAPHVRRAVLIGKTIDLKTAESTSLTDVLDGLSAGLFLTEANGRIVHANAAGHAILAEADFLYAAGDRLVARNPRTNHLLRDVVAASGEGDAAIGSRGVAVPLAARDGGSYLAHILPLTSGMRRRTGVAYAAAAAIFVRKAELDLTMPPEAIARHFQLTPTELRVLLAIVDVGGVPEVAAALGVADTTVKTHLGRLYEKTGAGRQADLVKIVAGFASPLAA